MKTILTMAMAVSLCHSAFAQPVIGTTYFNSATTTVAASGPSPRSGTLEGWNISIYSAIDCAITHPAGTVVLVSTPVVTGLWQRATFASSDGSAFQLKNFTFKGVTSSFLGASFNITGYKNGSPVAGASVTTVAIAVLNNYYTLDVSLMPGFLNIDEFRITPTILNVQGNLTIDDITIGAAVTTLPVVWSSPTTARVLNGSVLVQWSAENLSDNSKFVIERSSNGTTFTDIATMPANASRNYSYTDRTANNGKNFYRIRAIDADGKSNLSNIASAQLSKENKLTVYPNPATDKITVNNIPPNAAIQLMDNSGRILLTQNASSTTSINVSHFQEGIYFVKIKGAKESVQFVKE